MVMIFLILNISCSSKVVRAEGITEPCTDKLPCMELFDCSKQLLKKGEYRYRFSDSIASRQLLLCTGQLASEGNKEAHKYLIEYFNVKKAFHVNHHDRYQQNPAIFASSLNSPEVVAFSKLRGTEAFELALAYIERCVCRPFIKNSDETYPSEETYTIIDYIIDPMIKTIDGKNRLYLYFNLKPELISTPIKGVSGKIEHEYKYNALKKAYNEGKIILKKYGE